MVKQFASSEVSSREMTTICGSTSDPQISLLHFKLSHVVDMKLQEEAIGEC